MTMQVTDNNPGLPQRPPNLLPAPPVYSSRELGWGGLLVERYQYPGGEYRVAPLPVHSLVLHLGRPLRMGQRRDGKTHTSLFLTNHFVVVPAGLPNTCWHKDGADELFINVDPQFVTHTAETVGVDPGRVEVANNFGARDPQLHYIALSLLQELRSPGLGGRLYVESLTNQLAVHLLRYYSTARFRVRTANLMFKGRLLGRLMFHVARRFPAWYEDRLAWMFPAWFLYFELEAVK